MEFLCIFLTIALIIAISIAIKHYASLAAVVSVLMKHKIKLERDEIHSAVKWAMTNMKNDWKKAIRQWLKD